MSGTSQLRLFLDNNPVERYGVHFGMVDLEEEDAGKLSMDQPAVMVVVVTPGGGSIRRTAGGEIKFTRACTVNFATVAIGDERQRLMEAYNLEYEVDSLFTLPLKDPEPQPGRAQQPAPAPPAPQASTPVEPDATPPAAPASSPEPQDEEEIAPLAADAYDEDEDGPIDPGDDSSWQASEAAFDSISGGHRVKLPGPRDPHVARFLEEESDSREMAPRTR